MAKIIYITRQIPEVGLKLLKEKGIEFDIGEHKLPPTRKSPVGSGQQLLLP
jgi:hypothetical protein